MPLANLAPNERYALVGKTRSGKTALAMVLAGTFARTLPKPWEVWWIDTKNDPDDIMKLRDWGFRNAASPVDRSPESGGVPSALYWYVESSADKGLHDGDTVGQVQEILQAAYNRKHVIVVIDEYVQATPSARSAGPALLNIFQRGGGRNVGIIGLTQEPVYVPRQLISQATHICLLSLTFERDIKYAKDICRVYKSPNSIGDKYGFWWSWVDGSGDWSYYRNQADWYADLKVASPRLAAAASVPG